MPKRKTYKGRQTQRSGNTKRRRTGTYQFQGTRYVVPRTMGPFAASESKYFDSFRQQVAVAEPSSWAGTEIDPATLNTLFCPTEGSDIDNRVGRKVQVYKLAIRGIINTPTISDFPDIELAPSFRIIIFQDKQTNGVQAQGEELMETAAASTDVVITGFQNRANFGRFKVLKDLVLRPRIITSMTDGTATSSQGVSAIHFKVTVKFKKPVVVKFNATNGGTVGDIVDNSFHMIAVSTSTSFASQLSYTCRGYYKDN